MSRETDREGLKSWIIGALVALAVYALPFARFVFSYLTILVHELGHTAVYWAFGYPAIPAFDFRHGGGLTMGQERSTILLLLIYGLLAAAVVALRDEPGPRNLALAGVGVYSLFALTSLHELAIAASGIGAELLIAGVFLYRGWTGAAVIDSIERPLYAACGFFIALGNMVLAWGLMTDVDRRTVYLESKPGLRMDLDLIAHSFLGLSLPTTAFFLFAGALAVVPLSLVVARRGASPA